LEGQKGKGKKAILLKRKEEWTMRRGRIILESERD